MYTVLNAHYPQVHYPPTSLDSLLHPVIREIEMCQQPYEDDDEDGNEKEYFVASGQDNGMAMVVMMVVSWR